MSYLDVNKSVMISSPAGSGKTEKLARRYIALLRSGVDVERILAVTFTDKAAAEMKHRILRILKKEDEKLFFKLLEKMSLMRVSTIHSFCGTLLRRFAFETSLDPNYVIEDAVDSRIEWDRILYEILMDVGADLYRAGKGKAGHGLLLQALSERGFKGLDHLKDTLNYLFEKNPFSLEAGIPDISSSASRLAQELRDWHGAGRAIDDYGELFEDNGFARLITAEKLFLTKSNTPRKRAPAPAKGIIDYQGWAEKMFHYWKEKNREEFRERAERLMAIFNRCFERYSGKKALKGVLDFSDLEYIVFRVLTDNPEWSNILYAFDEKTDHILVDEFQDTNNFQWGIIDRLTEEWRSGLGAKREEGKIPTIFLVGDEKQSIYFFRGANVEIFNKAKVKLEKWLGKEFYYEEVKENFRSLQAIIDFTNALFSNIMRTDGPDGGADVPPWITRYGAFRACRTDTKDRGKVEIILFEDDEASTAEARQKEADIMAQRIQGLINGFRITEKTGNPAGSRPCRYMDIALLLRKRTHLKKYEEAFRRHNVPFVAVKGIGFYQEPEIAILRALTFFLSNPYDDYSLYILLKSPFFLMEEGSILRAVNSEGDCLFSKWRETHSSSAKLLDDWLSKARTVPLSELIEEVLAQTKAWEFFHGAQQRANVKKFIKMVEDLEAGGKSLLKIRDFLERTENRSDEPKANVNTEGMDAVRIMTIHGAKGLEFPVVFVPGLDEGFFTKSGDSLIYDKEGKLFFKYAPKSAIRQNDEDFVLQLRKEEEEQKRLFYVAVTRAEQALFLTGRWSGKNNSFLGFLKQGIGLQKTEDRGTRDEDPRRFGSNLAAGAGGTQDKWETSVKLKGLSIVSEREVEALRGKGRAVPGEFKKPHERAKFIPIRAEKPPVWRAVTETVDIRRRHGKDWEMLGDIIHRLFEDISKAVITESDMRSRAGTMLAAKGIINEQSERLLSIIDKEVHLLKEKGIWQDVIMPRDNTYSELPFVLEKKDTVYKGRIDRVINEEGIYKVYDYKTFPVDKKEMNYLLEGYAPQLNIYKDAVKSLFDAKDVRSYIIFTHTGEVKEVK